MAPSMPDSFDQDASSPVDHDGDDARAGIAVVFVNGSRVRSNSRASSLAPAGPGRGMGSSDVLPGASVVVKQRVAGYASVGSLFWGPPRLYDRRIPGCQCLVTCGHCGQGGSELDRGCVHGLARSKDQEASGGGAGVNSVDEATNSLVGSL